MNALPRFSVLFTAVVLGMRAVRVHDAVHDCVSVSPWDDSGYRWLRHWYCVVSVISETKDTHKMLTVWGRERIFLFAAKEQKPVCV